MEKVAAPRRDRQVVRILGILKTLLEGGRPTVYELAARFKTRRETIYRDLRALQDVGYPVEGDEQGRLSRPRLAASLRPAVPPVVLTRQELAGLVWSAKRARGRQPFGGALQTALPKLQGFTPRADGHVSLALEGTLDGWERGVKDYAGAEPTILGGALHDGGATSLGELIHAAVRHAIEVAVHEELEAALGADAYERTRQRRGYRNGTKPRTLTGPTGPVALAVPRATLFTASGRREWTSALLPRYQRRLREVNQAVIATYLAGGNTRRLRGALAPLLKGAPLSRSAVSRIVGTLHAELEAWRTRPLAEVAVVYLYLDALALRVRRAGKVVSTPVLAVVGVLADGHKQLLALELCGGESFEAWKGCVDDLVGRGVPAPILCVIDGHPGRRRAVELGWPTAAIQRCCVHKLRNLERKAPKHALAELRADFHRIVYAASEAAAHRAPERGVPTPRQDAGLPAHRGRGGRAALQSRRQRGGSGRT